MTRPVAILLASLIILSALATGHGSTLASSVARGFGWGVGREVAHGIFHERRY